MNIVSHLNLKSFPGQLGLGLVEIFVSLTVAMLLLSGLITLMLNNQQAYRLDHNLAEIQNNGRYATTFMSRTIRLAGFRSPPDFSKMIDYPDLSSIFPTGSELIQGTNNNVNGSDTLTVRYQGSPSGNVFDCLAQTVNANQIAVNTFSVNNQGQLVCSAINNGVPNASNPAVLVDGIEAMHIRFGEDLNGDGQVDRYVPPGFAGLVLNNVVSIRIGLLIRSLEQVNPTTNNQTYALQDSLMGPFNDKYLRRTVTTTVKLRSSIGG